jgi:hypothetical protein
MHTLTGHLLRLKRASRSTQGQRSCDSSKLHTIVYPLTAVMMHDPLTRRRFRLPARMRGCGIRSRAWLAPIAFTACFVEAVEGIMGVTDAGLPALFEQLTDVFGVGAFAPGGGRFHTFLRDYRALLPTASAFADAWDELARSGRGVVARTREAALGTALDPSART